MSRLQTEFLRLYGQPGLMPGQEPGPGRVQALVLELARPADWATLSPVWRGVQADLQLPAPAIAVSGVDGCQLWFSLAEPVAAAQADAFLEGLRLRYLADVGPGRLRLLLQAPAVPAQQPGLEERWSAFVAPDLAAVFADEPWLDTPPNPEGQADLLARLRSMAPDDFQRALAQLAPPAAVQPPQAVADSAAPVIRHGARRTEDPRAFLLDVMNDDTVPMALRIEAAKALLPSRA